jgi:hypothetical protein
MSTALHDRGEPLFEGGPPFRLEGWLHLRRRGSRELLRAAVLTASVAWLPLLVLVAVDDILFSRGAAASFIRDIAVHTRNLLALPILILAEAVCIPRLSALAQQFADAGLVSDSDRGRFEMALASTKRLRDSLLAEIIVLIVAYALVIALSASQIGNLAPRWQLSSGGGLGERSLAGWWHLLVSLPLLLVLVLSWIWRVVLWGRFLWLMSRLRLRLLPSHPDYNGGLRFLGESLRAFTLTAFGLSVIVAGGIANRVVFDGASPLAFRYLLLGWILSLLILFASPLLVFSTTLLALRQRGVLEYGTLADRVGRAFERSWLDRTRPFGEDPLETQAFSATTDLYQIVGNVYELRMLAMDLASLALLLASALLPFVPVLLVAAPPSVMLAKLARLLF